VTPTATFACTNAADSGPDSGVNDDCRWPISSPSWLGDDGVYFDTLSFQAVNGAFSIEGGGDGDVPKAPPAGFPRRASFLELAGELVNCGESTTTLPADLTAPQVTVRRLANADPTPCSADPITVTHGPLSATILKPLDQQTTAQFVLDIVWTEPVHATGTASTTATRMNFQTPRSVP
jgi:hypothetical protein